MADKISKTTSGILVDIPINTTKASTPHLPNKTEAQIVTRLADNITEGYEMVKQRQQKLNDLTNQQTKRTSNNNENCNAKLLKPTTDEWLEGSPPQNKLKRKKVPSASLISGTGSVNQEKRTRIEGMQLNCRGKLPIKKTITTEISPPATNTPVAAAPAIPAASAAPPVQPKSLPHLNKHTPTETATSAKLVAQNPPPRLKRKLQENVQTIQKLNALTEQLRLEINELKSRLTTEKGAVRVLRAQNEAEARKWQNEVKKLQNAVDFLKKAAAKKCDKTAPTTVNLPQAAVGELPACCCHETKEANKALEERKAINSDADRRKAADIRELKDSYEIRLTQIQKSAKTEISRLLQEIKSKENNIGQLKKDLQTLRNSKNISRNATTLNINQTNKTTTLQNAKSRTNKKPKSDIPNANAATNKHNEESSKDKESSKEATKQNKDLTNKTPHSNQISKLKNIELLNNTKNVTTNLQKSTKILNTQCSNNDKNISNNGKENEHENQNENENENGHENALIENNNVNENQSIIDVHQTLKALEIPDISTLTDATINLAATTSTMSTTTNTTTTQSQTSPPTPNATMTPATSTASTASTTGVQDLQTKAIQDAKDHDQDQDHDYDHHHYHHSDSDSALSSAPTSISPQPPANDAEPTDIWQTMSTYTQEDMEKLKQEVYLSLKQTDQLNQELKMAELEKNAGEIADSSQMSQLMERIKFLKKERHQLRAEANDLREQNELLEFRINELEWLLQSHTNPTSESSESLQTANVINATQNVWSCPGPGLPNNNNQNKPDSLEMLFGSNSYTNQNNSIQPDSGMISPHHPDEGLIDISNEKLCRRLMELLKKSSLEEDERHCLHQVLNLVQQLDALAPQSRPNSLNATSSSEEAGTLDLIKSRTSDYNDTSSANLTKLNNNSNTSTPRIVATVQPYNSVPPYTANNSHHFPLHNTPTESPRKARCQHLQTNSLTESGVFVESDTFTSDTSDNNVCTQTDFEDSGISNYSTHHIFHTPTKKTPFEQQNASHLNEQKRLQYYIERVQLLEGKIHVYESSGDVQAKRLAERLQREILLKKEVNELRDKVECLESENLTLEEEKCEFEEAENDTRLRLQNLEVELELMNQRNIELEMSREALNVSYENCQSECLMLRDGIKLKENQIRRLERDKQKVKQSLEFLQNILPLMLFYNTYRTLAQAKSLNYQIANFAITADGGGIGTNEGINTDTSFSAEDSGKDVLKSTESCVCHERELHCLKEEVKCLRHQINELNTRHYAALESADSHWMDLEKEYKEREEQFRDKEMCLKQKIQKLQYCLKEDARSANEKICQLEEAEQALKSCLVKVSKEHQKLQEDHQLMVTEFERFKEQHEQIRGQQKPLTEALETEKKRNRGLIDELTFMRKLQQETETQARKELEGVRCQMFDLKKDYLNIEVTNGELREEVATLELQIQNLEKAQRDSEEKIRCLTDEIRTKDEICQKLEKRLERSEGYSLADELGDTPPKRFKREDTKDLKTVVGKGLDQTLHYMGDCENMLHTKTHLKTIARDVKKLADTLLQGDSPKEKKQEKSHPKLILTEITRI